MTDRFCEIIHDHHDTIYGWKQTKQSLLLYGFLQPKIQYTDLFGLIYYFTFTERIQSFQIKSNNFKSLTLSYIHSIYGPNPKIIWQHNKLHSISNIDIANYSLLNKSKLSTNKPVEFLFTINPGG
eukprot:490259_1